MPTACTLKCDCYMYFNHNKKNAPATAPTLQIKSELLQGPALGPQPLATPQPQWPLVPFFQHTKPVCLWPLWGSSLCLKCSFFPASAGSCHLWCHLAGHHLNQSLHESPPREALVTGLRKALRVGQAKSWP